MNESDQHRAHAAQRDRVSCTERTSRGPHNQANKQASAARVAERLVVAYAVPSPRGSYLTYMVPVVVSVGRETRRCRAAIDWGVRRQGEEIRRWRVGRRDGRGEARMTRTAVQDTTWHGMNKTRHDNDTTRRDNDTTRRTSDSARRTPARGRVQNGRGVPRGPAGCDNRRWRAWSGEGRVGTCTGTGTGTGTGAGTGTRACIYVSGHAERRREEA